MAAMAFQWSLAALETLMAEDQMDQHGNVLRAFSVVELWRLRRVCRAFHRWGTAALAAMPRIAAIGGQVAGDGTTDGVEVLDLSTMRWHLHHLMPALPAARRYHSSCSFPDGRVVVVGGESLNQRRSALQWAPGATIWTVLPNPATGRQDAVAVPMADGKAMAIGGWGDDPDKVGLSADGTEEGDDRLASVEMLAADGSGWSTIAPMGTHRDGPAAAVLRCGKVLVAGGYCDRPFDQPSRELKTAELWDPQTEAWSDLPPMAGGRQGAGSCVLPSGRVAVVGGFTTEHHAHDHHERVDGEAFDPRSRTWQPLPNMTHHRNEHGVVAVAGGMLAVGGVDDECVPDELFDEVSGKWLEMPHPMIKPRLKCSGCVVSLPAAALLSSSPPPAAAAAAPVAPTPSPRSALEALALPAAALSAAFGHQ
eukprot:COSAG04_NODE_3080_length_3189_cov_3.872168_2_plen_422_part_00